MTVAIMVAGAVAVAVAWRLVARGRVSIWPAMSGTLGVLGVAALLTGRVSLSPRVRWPVAGTVGLGSGVGLYLATAAFVLLVRRWPQFDRHVQAIYDQRKGLGLGSAMLLASGANAPGEELFWRGLFQWRLARAAGWPAASAATWFVYAAVNVASQNLPIVAGGIVGGAVWSGLAFWTHGVLASLSCHGVWTALMLAFPPGGPKARTAGRRASAER